MPEGRDWLGRALRPALKATSPALQRVRQSLLSERDQRANAWVSSGSDRTLRLDYPLGPESLVFDLGGYEGQWASDIFARYLCRVWVFEPVASFAQAIRVRFEKNPGVRVFALGLAGSTRREEILVEDDRSSIFTQGGTDRVPIDLVQAGEFFREHGIDQIDLMKINIEGGEYDLLGHLTTSGLVEKIADIQVQFHDFVPNAAAKMGRLQDALKRTHELTYQSPFVWENWRRR